MSDHPTSCSCDSCYWSRPWLRAAPGGAWEQWQLEQEHAADRAGRRVEADREERLVTRWNRALTDRQGTELDRAHREHRVLAGICAELWRAAYAGDEWAADVRPEWKARTATAFERVAAAQGDAALAYERWLFAAGDDPSPAVVADGVRGYVEVPSDREDPEERALADAAVALAVDDLDLAADLERRGVDDDRRSPTVRFLEPVADGVEPDWPARDAGDVAGQSLWPDKVWLRTGLDPALLAKTCFHEVRHLAQGDSDPDDPSHAHVEQWLEADAVEWAERFVERLRSGGGL